MQRIAKDTAQPERAIERSTGDGTFICPRRRGDPTRLSLLPTRRTQTCGDPSPVEIGLGERRSDGPRVTPPPARRAAIA